MARGLPGPSDQVQPGLAAHSDHRGYFPCFMWRWRQSARGGLWWLCTQTL